MNNSVKSMMPIPKGYIVLTEVATPGNLTWVTPEESGYSFRLAEHADGTTALCRIYPDDGIYYDRESVLLRDMYCMHCGEHLTPDLDSVTSSPDPYNYHCAACGHDYEIDGEDEIL